MLLHATHDTAEDLPVLCVDLAAGDLGFYKRLTRIDRDRRYFDRLGLADIAAFFGVAFGGADFFGVGFEDFAAAFGLAETFLTNFFGDAFAVLFGAFDGIKFPTA